MEGEALPPQLDRKMATAAMEARHNRKRARFMMEPPGIGFKFLLVLVVHFPA
jgi:hypothetical protein